MGDPEVASSSTGDNQREKDILAIRLLRAIREKKVSEAKKILEEKPNILFKDKDGCQCLHFAAQEGVLDLVKLLLEEGAHVNCFDHNGQSPLHKAASRGHLDVVIHLVASGAQVGSLDWANHTPFEKAVISRSVEVVEVLLTFGAEPNLQDWTWAMGNLGEKEKKIQDLITQHVPLVPGYKYEGIQFEVVCVKPNEDHVLEKLNLTVKAIDVRSSFIFFCRKMQSEYTTLKSLLKEDQTAYSDMFEIRTWGVTRKTLAFALTIEGVPKLNEHLHVVSPNGSIGRVDNHVKNEDENTTEVTLTLKMNTRGPTQFAIVSVFKKETFAISTDEAKIVPASEPDAEIDIPKGAFEKAAELQLNVVDTQDVNEDEEDESGPLLMTNVIDMSMSDGQQPKEEIVMKLPIHNKGGVEEEMCVLATSEEDPDDEDDWEIIEAERDAKGKAAVFRIKHFSIYAVTKKKFAEQQLQKVVDKINQSCKGTKRVHFFTMTKLDANNQFDVVIEIVVLKQLEDRKTHWINEGYEAPEMSEECEIRKEETFKIVFKGEIEEDIESERTIEFHKARKINSIVARVFIKCDSKNPKVGIKILKGESVFYDQEVIVNKSILGCCRYQTIRTERKEIFEYEEFQNMDVNCILPPEPEPEPELEPEKEPEPEVEQVESEPEPELEPEPEQKLEPERDTTLEHEVLPLSDNDSFDSSPVPSEEIERENERLQKVAASENTELTYSVLNPSSIHCLCKCLTLEEAGLFGLQMGLQSSIKQELFKAEHPSKELTFKLLRLWGGSKHSRARVKKIQKGLKTINRMDLFDAFSEAFREDLPFAENRRVYID